MSGVYGQCLVAIEHLVESGPARYTFRPVVAHSVVSDPLAPFSPAVRDWFRASFEAPTEAQARGWEAISSGHHTLIHAPTGSGKTLAAFLWTLDRLAAYLREHKGIAMRRSRIDEILLKEGLRWRRHETWFGERVDPAFAEKRGGSRASTLPRLQAA